MQGGAVEAYVAPAGLSALQDPADRTFAASRFRHCYGNTPAPRGPMTLGSALKDLLRAYCTCESIPWQGHDGGDDFFEQLQAEAMANPGELADEAQIPVAAQRMWTSALQLQGHEFCFILNYALRADTEALVEPAAIIARGINRLCVQSPEFAVHPPEDTCYRGGGFNNECQDFFEAGRKYRQPAYLATSFSQEVADRCAKQQRVRLLLPTVRER